MSFEEERRVNIPANNHELPNTCRPLAKLGPEELPDVDGEEGTGTVENRGQVAHKSGQHDGQQDAS